MRPAQVCGDERRCGGTPWKVGTEKYNERWTGVVTSVYEKQKGVVAHAGVVVACAGVVAGVYKLSRRGSPGRGSPPAW